METKTALLVTGSREGFTFEEFKESMDNLYGEHKNFPKVVIVGCARGIDTYCVEYFRDVPCWVKVYKANWDALGKKAGLIRNEDMLEELLKYRDKGYDIKVCAFRYNGSTGTSHMIKTCTRHGIMVDITDKSSANNFDFFS